MHREIMSDPSRFFSNMHRDVINRIGLISLNRGIIDAGSAARVAVEMIREFDAVPKILASARAAKRLAIAWEFAKALPVVCYHQDHRSDISVSRMTTAEPPASEAGPRYAGSATNTGILRVVRS